MLKMISPQTILFLSIIYCGRTLARNNFRPVRAAGNMNTTIDADFEPTFTTPASYTSVFPATKEQTPEHSSTDQHSVSLEKCAENPVEIRGKNGTVVVSGGARDDDSRQTCFVTITTPESQSMLVEFEEITFTGQTPFFYDELVIEECIEEYCSRTAQYSGSTYPYHSKRNSLTFIFQTAGNQSDTRVAFKFMSTFPEILTRTFTSNSTGIIASSWYNGRTSSPRDVLTLKILAGHVVMISFPYNDKRISDPGNSISNLLSNRGRLFIYTAEDPIIHARLISDGRSQYPEVFNTTALIFKFYSHFAFSSDPGEGFQVLFTMHPFHDVPVQSEEELFDCSTPTFQSFQNHLRCNLHTECIDAEDEIGCPYTTSECGGAISMEEKCLQFVRLPSKVSWDQALQYCRTRSMDLASFSTEKEFEEFNEFLKDHKRSPSLFIGLQSTHVDEPSLHIYKHILRWTNGKTAFGIDIVHFNEIFGHEMFEYPVVVTLNAVQKYYAFKSNKNYSMSASSYYTYFRTLNTYRYYFLCEFMSKSTTRELPKSVDFPAAPRNSAMPEKRSLTRCVLGHFMPKFLACDPFSDCMFSREHEQRHDFSVQNEGTMACTEEQFSCKDNHYIIPYTLVCDHHIDCLDGSDENFCVFEECLKFECGNKQCIDFSLQCDGIQNCLNNADEGSICERNPVSVSFAFDATPASSVIDLAGNGTFTYKNIPPNATCPQTHFRCPGFYCLPVFLRCNGVEDCPRGEDEISCEQFQCPGFYRCRGSKVCLHEQYVCDGVPHCPQHDDERFCNLPCPSSSFCTCRGFEFTCSKPFPAVDYPNLRSVNGSGSKMTPNDFTSNLLLIHLNLASCGLKSIGTNLTLPNLRHLDLSHNVLESVDMNSILNLKNLEVLDLSWNPITKFVTASTQMVHSSLRELHMSGLLMDVLSWESFSHFPEISTLNVSYGKFIVIESLSVFKKVKVLDMHGKPDLRFPVDIYKDLNLLKTVRTSNFKLCCRQLLPDQVLQEDCIAPSDEVSSCDNLLRFDAYRVFLWLFAVVAILGNASSFVVRTYLHRKKSSKIAFPIFVTHLSLSDFLMGVYLAIIGTADSLFRGTYLWNDVSWKSSVTCKVAGFLSLLSSEVSAFIICLITLDRFIVLHYPYSQVRFRRRSANVACSIAWVIGLCLAAVPLAPMASHWEFYSQTGICIPLPITRLQFAGQGYSFGVMIVLNFVLFLMIAVGQAMIYWSVRRSSMATNSSSRRSSDITLAYRLATVVVTDFLCWFPISVLGLMASQDVPIPGEVNVAVAIFVLPLNSALNPFLYTLNAVLEKRRAKSLEKLTKTIEARVTLEVKRNLAGKAGP